MTPAEIIARAYDGEDANQSGERSRWSFLVRFPEWEAERIAIAKVSIAALAAAGWAVVPVKPTTRMRFSGKDAYDMLLSKSPDGGVNWKVAFETVYCAMVEAGRAV